MKIGINASFLRKPDTGIGQVTRNVIETLSRLNRFVAEHKFVIYLEEPAELPTSLNFKIHVIKVPFYQRDDLVRKIYWEKFALPRQVKKDHCDLFISLYQCPTIIKNIPHIMVVHDLVWKIFPQYLNNFRKKIYAQLTYSAIGKTQKIIAVSNHTKNDLIKYLNIDSKKISVIYNGCGNEFSKIPDKKEVEKIKKKYFLPDNYILYVGGYDPRKNVEVLIKAFSIARQNPLFPEKVKLVLTGKDLSQKNPLYSDIKALSRKHKISSLVCFPGFISQQDLPAVYRGANIFIFPSLYEGFGLPVLEAMSAAVPVICSNSSSLPEVGGEAVLYFNPHSSKYLARLILEVLRDEKLREKLISKAINRAKNFSWEKFCYALLK